jgi:hypothetical protein
MKIMTSPLFAQYQTSNLLKIHSTVAKIKHEEPYLNKLYQTNFAFGECLVSDIGLSINSLFGWLVLMAGAGSF